MLCLFNGVVQTVKLQEHPEALHFGVDVDINHPSSPANYQKALRFITTYTTPTAPQQTYQPGEVVPKGIIEPIQIDGTEKSYYRSEQTLVLEVNSLATDMPTIMTQIYGGQFTSAEFGLEMIEGVQEVTFTFNPVTP